MTSWAIPAGGPAAGDGSREGAVYIVIVGGGRVGNDLARALLAMGHEALVIDQDAGRCDTIRGELGNVVLHGNGTEVGVLREAGAVRADVTIAATSRDEDNLAVCQLSKNLFNTPKTISLVKDPQNEGLFKLLGVDVTVNTTHLILSTIETEIPGQSLVHLTTLSAPSGLGAMEREMVSINIPPDASSVGKHLGELVLPPNSFISLVVKDEGPTPPLDDIRLEPGDRVVGVTTPDEEQLLHDTLTEIE